MTPARCEHCNRLRTGIAWCVGEQAYLCRDCYLKSPGAQLPLGWKMPKPPPPPKLPPPTAYAKFVTHVRDKLEHRTGHTVFYVGPGEIASFCPVCLKGTVSFLFRDTEPPSMVAHSQAGGAHHCSLGCTEEEMAVALA